MFLKEYAPDLKSTTAAKAFADLKYVPKTRISIFVNKTLNYSYKFNEDMKWIIALTPCGSYRDIYTFSD